MTGKASLSEEMEIAWPAKPAPRDVARVGSLNPSETAREEFIPLSSNVSLRQQFMVTEEHAKANLRVGLLLEKLDLLAEATALAYVTRFHPSARVVTASIDDLKVCAPPDLERDIVLLAQINVVGRTSVEVGIRIEHPDTHQHLGSCYFTMVARLEGSARASLPPLSYRSETDLRRAERAASRRHLRVNEIRDSPPSPEERNHLLGLHRVGVHASGEGMRAADAELSTWERTYPAQENVPKTIFGGYILHRAYVAAHMCAELVADHRALLVAANRINFYQPVRLGDKLHFLSRVTYTGRSSVSVETDIVRVSRDRASTQLSNTCVFTFVNVDRDLNPVHVKPVIPGSLIEDSRYLAARRRHRTHTGRREGKIANF